MDKDIREMTLGMENKLPTFLKYDLEGYRGFGVTEFPLIFDEVDNKVIGCYCNDEAGCALASEIGDTKEEVVEKLFKTLKRDGYIGK